MDAITAGAFLVMGLSSSLHCAGMCGPILWMMPFAQPDAGLRWLAVALYHSGRIAAYCLLAALFFVLRDAFHPQWQQQAALVCGGLLLLAGIASFLRPGRVAMLRPVSAWIVAALGKVAGRSNVGWLGVTGFLNGLLPCGMVYFALAAAMKAPALPQVLASLAMFGLGTTPMLLAVTLLRRKLRFTAGRWAPVLMLGFGLLLMLRGANLGIPYLSPERLEPAAQTIVPVLKCCRP